MFPLAKQASFAGLAFLESAAHLHLHRAIVSFEVLDLEKSEELELLDPG